MEQQASDAASDARAPPVAPADGGDERPIMDGALAYVDLVVLGVHGLRPGRRSAEDERSLQVLARDLATEIGQPFKITADLALPIEKTIETCRGGKTLVQLCVISNSISK
jgi:hypothetical protein